MGHKEVPGIFQTDIDSVDIILADVPSYDRGDAQHAERSNAGNRSSGQLREILEEVDLGGRPRAAQSHGSPEFRPEMRIRASDRHEHRCHRPIFGLGTRSRTRAFRFRQLRAGSGHPAMSLEALFLAVPLRRSATPAGRRPTNEWHFGHVGAPPYPRNEVH